MLSLFPLLAIGAGLIGWWFAASLTSLGPLVVPLLMVVMLCMGMTLRAADFIALKTVKRAFVLGLLLQFTVMPLLGLSIARLLSLPLELQVGMILVGSVAGGTASNVMTYLAKGNVALSVSMTATSTLASIAITPLWLLLLADQSVTIPALAIMSSLFQIIVLPIALGLVVQHRFQRVTMRAEPFLPPIAMGSIAIIIAIVVALNAPSLSSITPQIMIAPLLHNLGGLALGLLAARWAGLGAREQRTLALEVGMQNSGLAAALALKFFTPLVAVPAAIFSVWLNVTGALFAAIAARKDQSVLQD